MNSKAMGYLSILCSKTNFSQEMFIIADRPNTSTSEWETSVRGVHRDDYTVVVYDLESNGLPPLSDDIKPYVLCAEEEDVNVTTDPEETGSKEKNDYVKIWL